jgi:hypothetical protein
VNKFKSGQIVFVGGKYDSHWIAYKRRLPVGWQEVLLSNNDICIVLAHEPFENFCLFYPDHVVTKLNYVESDWKRFVTILHPTSGPLIIEQTSLKVSCK